MICSHYGDCTKNIKMCRNILTKSNNCCQTWGHIGWSDLQPPSLHQTLTKFFVVFLTLFVSRRIMRPTDVPDQGLLCDLLWSDPDKVMGHKQVSKLWLSHFQDTMGWGENDRGVSFTFGAEVKLKDRDYSFPFWIYLTTLFPRQVVAKFLHKHDFDLICRAHQVVSHISVMECLESWKLILVSTCRWLRMVTNSLRSASWSHSSRRPTTVASLTTPVSRAYICRNLHPRACFARLWALPWSLFTPLGTINLETLDIS